MTFEQLSIFVAVAEREHLTKAAEALHLTPSAVSAAIKALEGFYNVHLFHRVGRRIELTETGRVFLPEAKAVLARAKSAALILSEMGEMRRGTLSVHASQTIATYWLPGKLMRFHHLYPGIEINMKVGNTLDAAAAILEGTADVGFIEGAIDEPALSSMVIAQDELIVVVAPGHPFAHGRPIDAEQLAFGTGWVLREEGSGTRSEFEAALRSKGVDPDARNLVLTVPTNEAMLSAVKDGEVACAVSRLAARPYLQQGELVQVGYTLPKRELRMIRHKERYCSGACKALADLCREE